VFVAKLQSKSMFDFQSGRDVKAPPGPLPANVNPPRAPEPEVTAAFAAPASNRTAQPSESGSGLRVISKWFGFGGSEPAAASTSATPAAAKPKPAPTQSATASGAASKPGVAPPSASKPPPKVQTEMVQAPLQPVLPQTGSPQLGSQQAGLPQGSQQAGSPQGSQQAGSAAGLIAGASPVLPAGSFEGRWNAIR